MHVKQTAGEGAQGILALAGAEIEDRHVVRFETVSAGESGKFLGKA